MNSIFYYLFAACLSLQSLSLSTGFFFYLSDLAVILFILYAILFGQKISFNLVSLSVVFLALYILIANLINYYLYEDFMFFGFLKNYLKIVSITLLVIFASSIIKDLDLEKFFKALKIILQFHCVLIILDHYVVYPWGFDGGLSFSASG